MDLTNKTSGQVQHKRLVILGFNAIRASNYRRPQAPAGPVALRPGRAAATVAWYRLLPRRASSPGEVAAHGGGVVPAARLPRVAAEAPRAVLGVPHLARLTRERERESE